MKKEVSYVTSQPSLSLPVGHPSRPLVRRAFDAVLLAAASFVCFAIITTQVKSLRVHSPWQDDPYDAVVSFTMFFVPLLCGLCLVRVQLFRRQLPLAIQRVRDLLRASWLVFALIGATLAVDWTSVGLQADHPLWTTATSGLIAMLGATSAVWLISGVALRIASRQRELAVGGLPRSSVDLAGDVVAVVDQWTHSLGPLGRLAAPVNRWLGAGMLDGRSGVRRHPLVWAAGIALGFGLFLAAGAASEGGPAPLLALFTGVGACGMFAFLVIGGWFLGAVRSTVPSTGGRRRVIHAATLTCVSVPTALAFRDSLWWLVGSTSDRAGLGELAALLAVVGCAVFVAVLATETVAARRSPR
jgi:hypothetical protein